VLLARERGGKLVTNDFNLNRVANVEGVAVLTSRARQCGKTGTVPGEECVS